MEMKVEVSISLDGKRVTGNVVVEQENWQADPLQAVLDSINSQYGLELSRFHEDKDVRVECGDIIGRFDMDLTEELDEGRLKTACAWILVDISETGEVKVNDSEYIIDLLRGLRESFPVLNEFRACHMCYPFDETREEPMYDLVQHFNDHHDWSIGEIADWLETLDSDIGMKHAVGV